MKKVKLPHASGVLFVISLLMLISCKDDPPDPLYLGKWVAVFTNELSGDIIAKDSMIFNEKNNMSFYSVYDYPTNSYYLSWQLKADFTVIKDSIQDSKITHIGKSPLDNNGLPTGQIVLLSETEPGFNELLTEFGIPKTFNAICIVEGEIMYLKTDFDDNGIYEIEILHKK